MKLSPCDLVNNDERKTVITIALIAAYVIVMMFIEVIMFVCNIVALFCEYNTGESTYVCLTCITLVQTLRLFSRERVVEYVGCIFSVGLYCYAISIYMNKMENDILYRIIFANIIVLTIWYCTILFVVLIVIFHNIFNRILPIHTEDDVAEKCVLFNLHLNVFRWIKEIYDINAKRKMVQYSQVIEY